MFPLYFSSFYFLFILRCIWFLGSRVPQSTCDQGETQAVRLSSQHLSPAEPSHQPLESQFSFQWTSVLVQRKNDWEYQRCHKHKRRHLFGTLLSAALDMNSGVKVRVLLTFQGIVHHLLTFCCFGLGFFEGAFLCIAQAVLELTL